VLTISDRVSRGEAEDGSGDVLEQLLRGDGYEVTRRLVPDEADEIATAIRELAGEAALVLTTGGTGLAERDVTPEATRSVLEREAPGISQAIRADSIAKTPHGLLSRGMAGTVGRALPTCLASLLIQVSTASAASSEPVTLVAPFITGSSVYSARQLSDVFSSRIGTPVIAAVTVIAVARDLK